MTDIAPAGRGPVKLLGPEETRRRIAAALSGADPADAGRLSPPPAARDGVHLLTLLPPWVAEAGALCTSLAEPPGGTCAWLWCAPAPGAPGAAFPSQLALALPGGRYAVSTWDAGCRRITASESAGGEPLVCGPPFAGAPLVIAVRRVAAGSRLRKEEPK
ncbi:MAG: hypothetical protein ACM3RP_09295 [Chitinophagales bacterium]